MTCLPVQEGLRVHLDSTMEQLAAVVGTYCVASGIYTHLGHPPHITGSKAVTNLAVKGLDDLVGACFGIEPDPFKAAELIGERIAHKRKGLGLSE